MELRSEDALEEWDQSSLDDYTYFRAKDWISEKTLDMRIAEFWSEDEIRAFEIGVKIGRVVGLQFVERPAEDMHEFAICKKNVAILQQHISTPLRFRGHVKGRLSRLETSGQHRKKQFGPTAQTTAKVFEAIAAPHVDADKELLKLAKCGAATIHSVVHATDTMRYHEALRQSATSGVHLGLTP